MPSDGRPKERSEDSWLFGLGGRNGVGVQRTTLVSESELAVGQLYRPPTGRVGKFLNTAGENLRSPEPTGWSRNVAWFARGSGISLAVSLLGQAVQLGTVVLLTRVLGPAGFGLYAVGMSVVKLLAQLALVGMHNGMVRFIPDMAQSGRWSSVRTTVRVGLLVSGSVSVFVSVALFSIADLAARHILNEPDLASVLRMCSLGLPGIVMLHLAAHTCRAMRRMGRFAVLEYAGWQIPFILFAGLSLALGFQLAGVLFSFVLAAGGTAILAWLGLRRWLPTGTEGRVDELGFGRLVAFGIPVMLTGVGVLTLTTSDRLILARFWGPEFVGIYDTAAHLAVKLSIVLAAVSNAFAPLISSLHEQADIAGLHRAVQTAGRWATGLSLPAFLVFLLYPELVLSLFGQSFKEGAPVLRVLAASQLINVLVGPVGYALVMTGRQKVEAVNTGFLVLVNLGLNLILVPKHGPLGAAVATGISITVVNLLRLVEVRTFYGVWAVSYTHLTLPTN